MKKRDRQMLLEAMGAVNPFAFRNQEGRLVVYRNAVEGYQICLQMLWAEYPRGFVDIPLFMEKYQHIPLREAIEMCHRKEYVQVRIWDRNDSERERLLKGILQTLLQVSGVVLDENAFKTGLFTLDNLLERAGVGERTESGHLVNFIRKKQ